MRSIIWYYIACALLGALVTTGYNLYKADNERDTLKEYALELNCAFYESRTGEFMWREEAEDE